MLEVAGDLRRAPAIFENPDSDYDETQSEEIVEHRNAIKRLGRQIKASVRFDL